MKNTSTFKGIASAALLCCSFALNSALAQTTETFTSGTTNWIVPAGVTSITIECWGGGGGGGGAKADASTVAAGAAGGGGGYAKTTIPVNAGETYVLNVGAAGTAGVGSTPTNGGAGGSSTVTFGSPVVTASGGNGGLASAAGNTLSGGGTGGTGTINLGTGVTYSGGAGSGGRGNGSNGMVGGAAGGGAGSSANGSAGETPPSSGKASALIGGNGGATGGGKGGNGGWCTESGVSGSAGQVGANGVTLGGGGGGAVQKRGNTNKNGGSGARGEIRITYTVNICTANAGAALAYICENGTSAALGGTVGGLSTTGIWSDGGAGGTFTPSATDLNATWTAPAAFTGTATLTLTTTDGSCATSATASKTIEVAVAPATPVFNASPLAICAGSSATYTATAAGTGTTIAYSILSGGASIDANTGAVSSVTGNFTVRATATNNCGTSHADLAVTVNANPAAPTISANGPTAFCQGGNVQLSASQATGIVWSSTQTSQDITVSNGGTYTVTYTDGNGCAATSAPVTVTVNALPTPTITASGATTFCQGGNVTLTSSGASGNVWSSTETTPSITVSQNGSYSVTYTDGNGCAGTSAPVTVTVNANPAPVITATGSTTFCTGDNVTLTSSEATGNVWSTTETTPSITVDESAVITVTVTDGNGCTGTSSPVTTTESTGFTPVITAAGPVTFCDGGSVTISSSETSGNLWSTGEMSNSITVSQTQTVTLTNSSACSLGTSNTIVVTENPNPVTPTISANGPLTFCAGGNVVLTSSATSGNVWSNTQTTNAITVTQAGSYTVTTTNANGCSANSTATVVTVNAVPVAAASLTNAITITATPAGQTYQWINCTTNAPVAGATAATFTATANGSYKVIVTNASGCKDTSSCVTVSKVGLEDLDAASGINLYPNPSNGMVTITSDFAQVVNVTVFDASGKELIQKDHVSGESIDLTKFESGMYIFKIRTSNGMSSHRVIVE